MIKKHVFALSLALFTAGTFTMITASDVEAAARKRYCHTHYLKAYGKPKHHCHYKVVKSEISKKKVTKHAATVTKKKKPVSKVVSRKPPQQHVQSKPHVAAAKIPNSGARGSGTIAIADNYVGYSERRHRQQLMGLFNFAFNHRVDPSRTPWCAAFANGVLKKSGRKTTGSLTAASFLGYGKKTRTPKQGDIVVLKPGSRYHVGFYMGTVVKNGVRYVKVLGGNQSNQVKVTYYKASRVVAYRTS